MIPRYNRPNIEKIWSLENKFKIWTEIECLIAEKQASLGIIPKKAAKDIRKNSKFSVKEIAKIEIQTNFSEQTKNIIKSARKRCVGENYKIRIST